MKNIVKYLILASSVLLIACEDEEIKWEVEPVNQMLVVEGSFTDQLKKHQVKLSLSENYFANHATSKIREANVSITDGTNIYKYVETQLPGVYETSDSVAGTAGVTYTLNIDLKTPVNGTNHYYCTSLMKPSIKIDSLYAFSYKNKFASEDDEDRDYIIMAFVLFGQEPVTKDDYYAPEFFLNNIHLNDTVDEKMVLNDEVSNGKYANSEIFFFCNGVNPGDTMTLHLYSVTREYFDFINGVVKIAEYSDPLGFNGPPANAMGNIKGGPNALGYFLISSVGEGASIVIDGEAFEKGEGKK